MVSGMTVKGKDPMPSSSTKLPMHKLKGYAPWGGMTRNYRNEFYNF